MAAFAFTLSLDGRPLELAEVQRQQVQAALAERAPGQFMERGSEGYWAAFSGKLGEMVDGNGSFLLCDGSPETTAGVGGQRLLDLLKANREGLDQLEDREGREPQAAFLDEVVGSFAACFFDEASGEVLILRDRIGTRPAFYASWNGRFFAASECKILQAMGLPLSIDPEGFRESFRYRWVTEDSCLLAPVKRVPPGSTAHIRPGGEPRVRRYWRFRTNREPMFDGALEAYRDELDAALRASLRDAARACPRMGVLLSGGVDSSILAALAQDEAESCVAYCGHIAGFPNEELERARFAAEHIGMELREVEIDPSSFPDDFVYLARRMEEPPRHVNSLVLLQLIRQAEKEVDVLIQGDAADTLIGLRAQRFLRLYRAKRKKIEWLPGPILRTGTRILERFKSPRTWSLARTLAWDDVQSMKFRGSLRYSYPVMKILGMTHTKPHDYESADWPDGDDIDELRRIFLLSTGIDGSLIRHDRMTRPLGIESHTPFLTPGVVDIASRFPAGLHGDEVSKPILRALCDKYFPSRVSKGSKVGFVVPEEEWLFGPLLPFFHEAARAVPATGLLPKEYFDAVLKNSDKEGVTTGIYLYLVMRELGLLGGAD